MNDTTRFARKLSRTLELAKERGAYKSFQRMVRDAETHKETYRQFHELANVRNQADAEIHRAENCQNGRSPLIPA